MTDLSGLKLVADAPARIVAMTEFKGRFLVATEERVYELIDGVLHPMVFVDGGSGAGAQAS